MSSISFPFLTLGDQEGGPVLMEIGASLTDSVLGCVRDRHAVPERTVKSFLF